jgi:hypothetical protein
MIAGFGARVHSEVDVGRQVVDLLGVVDGAL